MARDPNPLTFLSRVPTAPGGDLLDSAVYDLQDRAAGRGHGSMTAWAGMGGLLGATLGSFRGPIGAAVGGLLGAGLGALIGEAMDEDG